MDQSQDRKRDFLHSNLFIALLIWFLTQFVLLVGGAIVYWNKANVLSEWRGSVDATLKRMDEQGTMHGHYKDETEDRDIADLQARMKRTEEDTRQVEVLKSENRRLTRDVEEMRHEKK